jgi:NADPH:quinone reductase-like Zn-dependent oxidoreductase
MKAIRIRDFGGSEKLQYEEVPTPEPGEGEVLVEVQAASVNPVDYKLASGTYGRDSLQLPWIPGGDFCGVIEKLGPGVAGLEAGAAVYGDCRPGGGYAEYVVTKAEWVAARPRAVTAVEAAAVPLAGQTAWQGLFDHGHLEKGQTVLIHGAPGGVGHFAVQLAHWKQAKVVATGSAGDEEYLRSLGADEFIDYKGSRFEDKVQNLDLVFDLIGGETLDRSYAVVKRGGAIITTVGSPSAEKAKERGIRAEVYLMDPTTANLAQLAKLLDSEAIKAVVAAKYPLQQAAEAWNDLLNKHIRGKIVLEVSP